MIRITKQADYAIILLGHFVTDSNQTTCTARDLASQAGLPLPMVGKILKSLVRNNLLVSHRGVKGGYGLAKPPEEITVVDIITAMDGPIGLTVCSVHAGDCDYEPCCPARTNWQRINQAVYSALKGISLREMARPNSRFFGQPLPVMEYMGAASTPCDIIRPVEARERPFAKETP